MTKCPIDLSLAKKQDIKKKLKVTSKQHVFFSTISYHNKTSGNQNIPLKTLSDYEIVLLTGIANPTPWQKCKGSIPPMVTTRENTPSQPWPTQACTTEPSLAVYGLEAIPVSNLRAG